MTGRVRVEFAWIEGAGVRVAVLELAAGATLSRALECAGAAGVPGECAALPASVYGRPRGGGYRLRDGDRIEFTAALEVDPKVARRRRVAHRQAKD